MMLVPLLLALMQIPSAAAAAPPAAVPSVPRHARRLFISPMGEPFRATSRNDDTLADWFEQADRNHDGRLTIEEMQQDAERFFATLDVNHDGEIDPDEIARYENDVAPEIRTVEHFSLGLESGSESSEGDARRASGEGRRGGHGRGGGEAGNRMGEPSRFVRRGDDQHQGAARYALLDLPEPVVSADTDFDRGVSLAEFRQAAVQRFLALDLDHHGYLTLSDLERIKPAPPSNANKPSDTNPSTVPGPGV